MRSSLRWWRAGPGVVLLLACGARVGAQDDDTTGGTATGAPESDGDAGSDAGADTNTDGPTLDDRYVDCAEIPIGPTVGPGDAGPLGFPEVSCDPRSSGSANGYQCCSTDPATADGKLPAYEGMNIAGSPPLFADAANVASSWGMCVRLTDLPDGGGLLAPAARNCPVPCDPTWADDDVAQVCGPGRVCCQALALGPGDCVQDSATGTWRPVTGADIGSTEISPPTNWNAIAHDTHQDPNGSVCLAASGSGNTPEFIECIRHLGVADRRGFCMALGTGVSCPGEEPGYIDACEAMNE